MNDNLLIEALIKIIVDSIEESYKNRVQEVERILEACKDQPDKLYRQTLAICEDSIGFIWFDSIRYFHQLGTFPACTLKELGVYLAVDFMTNHKEYYRNSEDIWDKIPNAGEDTKSKMREYFRENFLEIIDMLTDYVETKREKESSAMNVVKGISDSTLLKASNKLKMN